MRSKSIIFLVAAVSLLSSCYVEDAVYRQESNLKSFTADMMGDIILDPVLMLSSYAEDDIFDEDFVLKEDDVEIKLLSAADSTWTAKSTSSSLTFETVLKMLPEDGFGFRCWQASGSGSYDEGNGYTAKAASEGPIVFSWEESKSEAHVDYDLVFSGTFKVSTSYGSTQLDELSLTWKNASASGFGYSFWSFLYE